MKAGEALTIINSRFKEKLATKTSWGRNELLEEWTIILLALMGEIVNEAE